MSFRYSTAGSRALVALMLTAPALAAQDATSPQQTAASAAVPVRELGPIEARTERLLGSATMLRALPDGGFFINDNQKRQLLKFDATLKQATVIADTANAPLLYGQRPSGILPYLGDSTIVVDPMTLSFVVLNSQGKVARIMAPPRPNDVGLLAGANLGSHAFDMQGRMYYRINQGGGGGGNFNGMGGRGGQGGGRGGQGPSQVQQQGPGGPGNNRGMNPPQQPDSLPIVRADFDTRRTDTVAWVRTPRTEFSVTPTEDGGTRMTAKLNPLPQGDDWALLADGTVAVVRVLDYHVDYFAPDGTVSSSPKLPFDWKHISDEEKVRLIDSLKVVAKEATDRLAQMNQQGGGGRMNMRTFFEPVEPQRLPDYFPPIRPGSSIADHEGNLWILPATSSIAAQLAQTMQQGPGGFGGRVGFGGPPGGGGGGDRGGRGQAQGQGQGVDTAQRRIQQQQRRVTDSLAAVQASQQSQTQYVYDIVNRKGELVERIKLPLGRQLLGFGPGGMVYMTVRDGRNGVYIERARRTGL